MYKVGVDKHQVSYPNGFDNIAHQLSSMYGESYGWPRVGASFDMFRRLSIPLLGMLSLLIIKST